MEPRRFFITLAAWGVKHERATVTDEKQTTTDASIEEPKTESPAAEPKNTEIMIPKARFDEVNSRLRELEKKLSEQDKAQATEAEKRMAEQNEWKELAEKRQTTIAELSGKVESLSSAAERLTALQSNLLSDLANEAKEWPDSVQALLPDDDAGRLDIAPRLRTLASEMAKTIPGGNAKDPKPAGNAKKDEERRAQFAKTIRRF